MAATLISITSSGYFLNRIGLGDQRREGPLVRALPRDAGIGLAAVALIAALLHIAMQIRRSLRDRRMETRCR